MESTRKRLGFLADVAKAKDADARKAAIKAFKDAAKQADKSNARALSSHDPTDHAAASRDAKIASGLAERAYHTGQGSRASNESLHDDKRAYASTGDLHDKAAAGDKGALGHLHLRAATDERWSKHPDKQAEGAHTAAAINAFRDDADKHATDAVSHRVQAEAHEAENRAAGGNSFSSAANRALNARNNERWSQGRADASRDTATRAEKDHADALSASGHVRDEHGRFAPKG